MIKIKDNGEKLVEVGKACPGIVLKLNRPGKAYLREGVAKRLNQAKKYLPQGITFVLHSAWRSQKRQKKIYYDSIKRFTKENPKLSQKQVLKQVKTYVAPYKGKNVSGHMTGGAFDIRLWRNGRRMPMKSKKLTYQENSKSDQAKLPAHIKKNRQIMFQALKKAGLSNYLKEFWHWSYGDFRWAKRGQKKTAIYEPIYKLKEDK